MSELTDQIADVMREHWICDCGEWAEDLDEQFAHVASVLAERFVVLPKDQLHQEPRERFERDAAAWQQKSLMMSSVTDMAMLPEYQRIIGLGPAAVPLIIDSLRVEADHWFWALTAITGEDHAAGAETVPEAACRWIEWYDTARWVGLWRPADSKEKP